jgi:FtsP/CotA-like multicopper oxidase with cupredoxin domain
MIWVRRLAVVLGCAAAVGAVAWLVIAWNSSRVPDEFSALEIGTTTDGGGPPAGHDHNVSVAALHGSHAPPDVRVRLVARHADVRLPSGRVVRALTFDGTLPGPELRVHEGDLLEVTLVNRDVREGVSIHWHGVDVPNAEDGVSGVTQNAVPPGRSYVYRFRADVPGTYWYHSHQHSAGEVERGLYGPLVVLPRRPQPGALDLVEVAHTVGSVNLLGASDREQQRSVRPGTPVRLRLVNSSDTLRAFALAGTPFRVVAIDAREKEGGKALVDEAVDVPAGGRYDLAFSMPATTVRLAVQGQDVGLVLSAGRSVAPEASFDTTFDPATYGTPAAPVPRRFDRRFDVKIGRRLGFFEGGVRLGWQWTLNGKAYPDMPMYKVGRDETIEFRFSNSSKMAHPMHLHGHHMLVLARDGRPVTPWWSDTLEVGAGERYDVAVFSDNPGIWMFHCHNLPHAARGLVTHMAYHGVTTPYRMGSATSNDPE